MTTKNKLEESKKGRCLLLRIGQLPIKMIEEPEEI